MLLTVTDFLDTDYVAMLREQPADARARSRRSSCCGAGAGRHRCRGRTCWPGPAHRGGRGAVEARAAAIGPDDLSDILFTSGTTGKPKGAMLRHGASVRAYDAWSDVVGLRHGDRYLIINPFFHSFGLKAGILACLIKGATIVPHAVFDVPSVMTARRRGAHHDAPRTADDLPDDPRPPRPRPRSTSRRCASPSPVRRPFRSR